MQLKSAWMKMITAFKIVCAENCFQWYNCLFFFFLHRWGTVDSESVITHNGSRSSSSPGWSCRSTLVHLKDTGECMRVFGEETTVSTWVGTHPTSRWKPWPPEPCSSGPRRKGKGHRAPPCWPRPPRCSGAVLFRRTETGTWKPDHATHQSKTFLKKYSGEIQDKNYIFCFLRGRGAGGR